MKITNNIHNVTILDEAEVTFEYRDASKKLVK